MTSGRATLKEVSSTVLQQLRDAVASGTLKPPLGRAALVGFGVRHQLEAIELALAGHKSAACLAVLDVALAEREDRKPTPELVWTGPEAPAGTARDTAVVLRELFEGARESVILGGYSFKYARDVLAPLHRSMRERAVDARFFVHVPQVETSGASDEHLERHLGGFLAESWPFGDPRPRIYYDKRCLVPGPPLKFAPSIGDGVGKLAHDEHERSGVVTNCRSPIHNERMTPRGFNERVVEAAFGDLPVHLDRKTR